jgi:hypothetical protein
MMNPTAIVGTLGGLAALFGGLYAGVQTADSRYQPRGEYVTTAEFKNIEWSLLRREVRELKADYEANPDDAGAREDYLEALDRFCLSFPQDRLCKD